MRTSDLKRRDGRAQEKLQTALDQIEGRVQRMTQELRMTGPMRTVARKAFDRVKGARKFLILPRHSATQRRFLRAMIELALATDPSLQRQAVRIAKFYSRNYAFEWLINPVSAPARDLARDTILRAGDSQYGETPMAGPVAYVMFHWDEVGVKHLADYSGLYLRAMALERISFWRDRGERRRKRLGVPNYAERPSLMTPTPAPLEPPVTPGDGSSSSTVW